MRALVSYDGSDEDRDALAFGDLFARAGAALTLAYVRHPSLAGPVADRRELAAAETMLDAAATLIGRPEAQRRVVVSPATSEGLRWLVAEQRADVVVFGSAYRTSDGHVSPGATARALLDGGPAALAIAPAGWRADLPGALRTVGVLPGSADEAAIETARSLARATGARMVAGERGVSLLVVGSRLQAPPGRVMISSAALSAVERATAPVLVIARGTPLELEALVGAC